MRHYCMRKLRDIFYCCFAVSAIFSMPSTAQGSNTVGPILYVLSIGINKYIDKGFRDPRTGWITKFSALNLAVPDATAVGAAFQIAGKTLYKEVKVTYALNEDASIAKLDSAI